jgi:hypothetical protein
VQINLVGVDNLGTKQVDKNTTVDTEKIKEPKQKTDNNE